MWKQYDKNARHHSPACCEYYQTRQHRDHKHRRHDNDKQCFNDNGEIRS